MIWVHRLLPVGLAGLLVASAACSNPEAARDRHLENGTRHEAEGRLREAIVEYRNAVKEDPMSGDARWKLAEAYSKGDNIQAAFREYIRAADLLPDSPDVQVRAGALLLMGQQFEDARARADRALAIDPNHVEALVLRANATANLKDVAGAIREIEEALKTKPDDGRIYASLGAFRFVEGQRLEAEVAFKKAVELSPDSVETRLALANFYMSSGRAADVERTLNEARAINPSHPMLNRMLAVFYLASERTAEAEEPLKKVAEQTNTRASTLALADYYIGVGRPDEAQRLLGPLAEANESRGEAVVRLASIERSAGNRDRARQMLVDLVADEPRHVTAQTLLSGWLLRDGDRPGALKAGQAAVEADPSSAQAHFALAQAQIEEGQADAAARSLREVLKLNPRVVSAQVILSRLELAGGDPAAAVAFASDAKKAAPANPDVQVALARSLIAQGNLVAAEPEVKGLLSRFPKIAATHNTDGMFRLARRDAAGARASFERALEFEPESVDALLGLLMIDSAAGSLPAAVTRIESRLASSPGNAELLIVAARTFAAAGKMDRMEQTLRRVLAIDPDNFEAYLLLGQSYGRQRRLDEALAELDAAVKRQPTHVGAATMAALIVQIQNKEGEAQKRYEAILAANPRAPIAANNLAWLYSERGGNLDVALQLAQTAKAQLPDSHEINDTLGWIYVKKELPRLAIPLLEQSVARQPKNAGYQVHLGVAYAKNGDRDKAAAALQAALANNPTAADAELARQTLATLKS